MLDIKGGSLVEISDSSYSTGYCRHSLFRDKTRATKASLVLRETFAGTVAVHKASLWRNGANCARESFTRDFHRDHDSFDRLCIRSEYCRLMSACDCSNSLLNSASNRPPWSWFPNFR